MDTPNMIAQNTYSKYDCSKYLLKIWLLKILAPNIIAQNTCSKYNCLKYLLNMIAQNTSSNIIAQNACSKYKCSKYLLQIWLLKIHAQNAIAQNVIAQNMSAQNMIAQNTCSKLSLNISENSLINRNFEENKKFCLIEIYKKNSTWDWELTPSWRFLSEGAILFFKIDHICSEFTQNETFFHVFLLALMSGW